MTLTDEQVNEAYFKALGWKYDEIGYYWREPILLTPYKQGLPNPCQSWPDFKKWVLEKMEGEGFTFACRIGYAYWKEKPKLPGIRTFGVESYKEEIKDNEILQAAVIAATKYWENRK